MSMRFDPKISVIRVCAMLSIVVGRWLSMRNINHFQLGAIGVEIFLFISGYLYSDKEISNIKEWILNRLKRLIIPYWIVLGGCIIARLYFGYEVTLSVILVYFFNLQGIDKIFRNITIPPIIGMGQTWFLTVLMICYGFMIFLKKKPIIEQKIREHIKVIFLCSFLCQIILSFVGIQIIRPLCFFYGYFWNKKKLNIPIKKYSVLTVLLFLLTIIRFVVHTYFDNTILYDYIVFSWAFVLLAIWLIITTVKVVECIPGIIKKMVNSRIWRIIDLMTYPLFLTHYMFVSGEFAVSEWIYNLYGQVLLFLFLSCITALFVLVLSDRKTLKSILINF